MNGVLRLTVSQARRIAVMVKATRQERLKEGKKPPTKLEKQAFEALAQSTQAAKEAFEAFVAVESLLDTPDEI